MRDVRIVKLAARQFNRVSYVQLVAFGMTERAVVHAVASGRLVIVEKGVYAFPPVLADDDWGRWMAATLTAAETTLSHESAGAAWGSLAWERPLVTVTRPGSGGPRRFGGVLAFRSTVLGGDTTTLRDIPITTVPRTLLDLTPRQSQRAIKRAVREAVRLKLTTIAAIADCLGRHAGRRGTARLGAVIAQYTGLPIERARSGAEVRALELLRDAGFVLPRLNVAVAGQEADLSWPRRRVVIEVDGRPFHLDVGEDARKQARWERAGWTVRRIRSEEIYERPERLIVLAEELNVPYLRPER